MKFSDFGNQMNRQAGILQLMDDLGTALDGQPPLAMFGGGNPAQVAELTEVFKDTLSHLTGHKDKLVSMLGNYDTPQGNAAFIQAVKEFLNRHYSLGVNEDNIAITPGSQAGYFILFNLLAGKSPEGQKKIIFPIVPEYIGYVDQALEPDSFVSNKPKLQKIGKHEFKYKVDFNNLKLPDDIGGICVSRPTNPSGNVITDQEIAQLDALASKADIPLIIDNAYGLPFPGVIVPEVKLPWSKNTVLSMSLSKIGLPSSRVGIFVGPATIMKAMTNANAIISLANPSFGQYLATPLLESDEIMRLSRDYLRPYYFERAERARQLILQLFPDELPWRLHAYEGSYFYWLWLEGANKSSLAIYKELKARGVLVTPGEYFFPGQSAGQWKHASECLRINFARSDQELAAGLPLLAEAIRQAY